MMRIFQTCHKSIKMGRIKLHIYPFIFFFIILVTSSQGQNADFIIGKWSTENNEGVVEIFKQGEKYFAKLIALKTSNDTNGKPRKDSNNKEDKLKTRNLLGILIFGDMEYSSEEKQWENGYVYDPDMGHTADGIITMMDNNTIKVKGYAGFKWVSLSQIWKRKLN